ncbi:unnamed protein product [Closterium sp. NIES-54]
MAVAVWYTADQLNLWPRVSFPETSPTLRWTGKVGDASVFRVWGSRALVCDNSADKLSSRAIPCTHSPWMSSGAAGGGAARGVASGGAEPAGAEPGVAEPASAEPGGAQPEGAEPGGAETDGAEPRGAESEGAESWAAEPRGSACAGGLAGRGPVVLSGHADASWFDDLATQRLSQGYTFYLGSGSISWRSTCSSSVLISSYKAEIYAGAIAAQELHWLTYLLTNLGERPRSPPVLYVDNKAMIALCQEHKLEHRMKHIALHYFLAQELQERGQLRLAYVATRATPHDSRESIVLLAGDGTNTPSNAWFLDIGVTQHMTHSALFLTNVGAPRDVTRVIFGNDKSLPVVGVGSTRLIVDGGPVDITNVFHGPGLKVNLLSVSQLAKKGVTFTMDDAKMNLFWKGKQFAQSVLNGELYQLKTHPRVASSNVAQGSKATLKAWHNRIAHANYFIVTRLPDSLRSVRDHFLSLDPTSLTVDILEQHLLAAETSAVADDAACGTPCTPFFEGCPPSPLAPSYAFAAAVDVLSTEDVGVASVSTKRRSSKGRGGRDGEGGSGSGGGGSSGGSGGGGSGGNGRGSGGVGGGGGGSGGSGGRGSGGSGGGRTGAQRGGSGGGQRQRQQHRSETPSPHQLREWLFQRGACGSNVSCPYVIRTGDRAGQTCGKAHTQHRCFSHLNDAWHAEFDYDAILSIMYALSASAEGDYYRCVPPDTGIDAAALGASESSLPGTAPAEALHAFTLDSGASRCFFRDSTTLTPLPAPVPVRLADPSGGSIVARSSTILPCLAVPSGSLSGLHLPSFFMNLVSTAALQDAMVTTTNHGGQRVSICTCTRTGRHMATFTRRPGSSLYTLVTEPPQVAASSQVSASSQVAPPCSCRIVSHQNLLWHHCLGHPPLPRLRGMHSRLLISSLPRSLPPLPPSPALPCLSCVEGRQRAAPYSSSFPPTTAPLLTLHMDVWGPARVSGQSCERDFLLVVDDYTRYTTVFPLHSKGEVVDVLIPSIRTVRLQLRKRFGQDLPVLRLHSDRGGEFSSNLLRDFFMEVARTSMIHAAAPHFLWPFASYHPTSRHVFPSQDVTFDESVPFYRIFPYHSALPPPPPLFLAPGPPPVDPFPPQGPAPSGVSLVDPLPGVAESEGAGYGGDEPGGEEPGGAEPAGGEPGGAKPGGVEPGGADSEGAESGGAESEGAESGGAEPLGAASSKGPTGASSRLSPQQLCEWLVRRARLRSGAPGAGAVGARGVGVTAGAGEPGGTAAAGPGGARTRGTGAARTGGVGGAVL